MQGTTLERVVAALEGTGFEHGVIAAAPYRRLATVCAAIDAELDGAPREFTEQERQEQARLVASAQAWAAHVADGGVLTSSDGTTLAGLLRNLADVVSAIGARSN
ncbi:hypothetical protein J2X63_000980 [Agromyces sp. 3263]|uniref:hypothetical protein n=1 Tax=Agromyces sp. 3263 TaxID=2817750 RepID=UPI0028572309|nr:hypothetical protein [Agromyces sp. 3263]MDR6905294.1 hypothetical protein [Agromyces sp. 3263]